MTRFKTRHQPTPPWPLSWVARAHSSLGGRERFAVKTLAVDRLPLTRAPRITEWRAWDRFRLAIEARNIDPTLQNEAAVRAASRAFVEACGETYQE